MKLGNRGKPKNFYLQVANCLSYLRNKGEYSIQNKYASLAQLAEQQTLNLEVQGSIP